mgnify:FL=1
MGELIKKSIPDIDSWLDTPQGRYVIDWEQARVDTLVSDLFGYNALQLGLPQVRLLQHNRIPLRQLAGEAGNVIPQTATLRLSTRTCTPETRERVLERIRAITAAQALSYGVTFEIREGPPGAVLVNDPDLTADCAEVAKRLLGEDQVIADGPTLMGSEDFAWMLQRCPGSYLFIGNGDGAHRGSYGNGMSHDAGP